MNALSGMKVGTKLIAGFLAVAVIGAIIGMLGIVKTNELSDLAKLMYEREMVGAQHVSAANMDRLRPRARCAVPCWWPPSKSARAT